MQGYHGNIEKLTKENNNFRQVLYTGKHSQLVLMSLLPGEEIGEEIHDVDQFFRLDQGQGKAIIDGHEYQIEDGHALVVPAGATHNIINISESETLKLYTLYCPPHHQDGIVHEDKLTAERDEEHFDGQTTE
ncbi:MAG: cupin domain-containing protein [Patescibacteria group bacterium]|nr:MAG: cupin domain-containing protein [Patescibacteria group bacterium]